MRVPVSWLREYVEFSCSIEELAHTLTIAGLEVENIEHIGQEWENIYVGLVLQVEKHPNADRLQVAHIDYGHGQVSIVTGAPNIAPGQKVALALAGATLVDPYSDQHKTFKLKPSKIRGILSEAMACSEKELGLGEDHTGILVLDPKSPVGAKLQDVLGDYILDIALTPNFSYANSIVGIAREVAALTGTKAKVPVPNVELSGDVGVDAWVESEDLAARYMLQRLDNVTIGPSSAKIRRRLLLCGMRPVNNVVDITNYVMLELGQPLHPFDADKVRGKVAVRSSYPEEQLETIDHQLRTAPPDTIMIADDEKPIAFAGIMGGLNTEVTDDTRNILLESATFNAPRIRRAARLLGLRSEASSRFEKGMDPELAGLALARAVELLQQECGAQPKGAPFDWYPNPKKRAYIDFPVYEVKRLLGIDIPKDQVERILTSLEFEVQEEGDLLKVLPPSYRSDVSIPADIVEEVGRIWGYEALPSQLPGGTIPFNLTDRFFWVEKKAREWLAAAGLQEVINYDLISARLISKMASLYHEGMHPPVWRPLDEVIKVINPTSPEREYLRPSLIPGLLQNVSDNLRFVDKVWIYELDRVFVKTNGERPQEPKRLAIAMAGTRWPISPHLPQAKTTIFDLKGTIQAFLHYLGIEVEMLPSQLGLDAVNVLQVSVGGNVLGNIFQVDPTLLRDLDIDEDVFVAELDWDQIKQHARLERNYVHVSRYPIVRQDLAVLVSASIPAGNVTRVIWEQGRPLLVQCELAEVYQGDQIPEGTKSLLYKLAFQAEDRTLTEEEATKVRQKIENALRSEVDAKIRGVDIE